MYDLIGGKFTELGGHFDRFDDKDLCSVSCSFTSTNPQRNVGEVSAIKRVQARAYWRGRLIVQSTVLNVQSGDAWSGGIEGRS
ncbi:predicted protein [Histoplasma mississippiense (nom. inval.)]|uniref:predicted protein n=1 Tax=Ajellomyces capsulatus (strain NAm1 / WU24) TaxID=2059318 RepID=UPI000157CABB|nr:predicted protein [Histoplasma mississippiense (nom. inval.)]EDN09536.1 predicted protein [Histoplasma mississippiense (nom. inval.)]